MIDRMIDEEARRDYAADYRSEQSEKRRALLRAALVEISYDDDDEENSLVFFADYLGRIEVDSGGCDHNVGICCCSVSRLVDDIVEHLFGRKSRQAQAAEDAEYRERMLEEK